MTVLRGSSRKPYGSLSDESCPRFGAPCCGARIRLDFERSGAGGPGNDRRVADPRHPDGAISNRWAARAHGVPHLGGRTADHSRDGILLDPREFGDRPGDELSEPPEAGVEGEVSRHRDQGDQSRVWWPGRSKELARLDRDVTAEHPDLVIWQFGTNAVPRRDDISEDEQPNRPRCRSVEGARERPRFDGRRKLSWASDRLIARERESCCSCVGSTVLRQNAALKLALRRWRSLPCAMAGG